MTQSFIKVTESAQEYLLGLLSKQDSQGMGVRIFVERPGTPHAECCMAYCAAGEAEPTDEKIELEGFTAFIDGPSVPFLEDAVIDYAKHFLDYFSYLRLPVILEPASQVADGPTSRNDIRPFRG